MIIALLFIIAALLPFGIALNPIVGFDVPLTRVIIALTGLIWLAHIAISRRNIIPRTWLSALIIAFVFLATLSIINATELTWFWRKIIFLFNFFILFFIITTTLISTHRVGQFLRIVAITGIGASLIGLLLWGAQFVVGAGTVLAWWNTIIAPFFLGHTVSSNIVTYSSAYVGIGGANYLRLVGVFPDPHMAAFFGELLLPLVVALGIMAHSRARWLWNISGIIVATAILATFTRGAYVGLGIGALLAGGYWLWHIRGRAVWIIASGTLAVLLLIAIIATPIGGRLVSIGDTSDGSVNARWGLWDTALTTIASNPLTGVGLGQYSLVAMPYADYRLPYYAHNLYLDIMVEIGIVGGLIWLAIIMMAIYRLLQHAHITKNAIPAGLAIGLFIFSVHALFDTPLFSVRILPLIIIFLALAALPATVWRRQITSKS